MKQRRLSRMLSFILSSVLIIHLLPYNVFAVQQIDVDVKTKPKVDIMLTTNGTDTDLSTFKDDLFKRLSDLDIDTSTINIKAIDTAVVDSNAFDASEIFNNWGRVGATGNWHLDPVKDKQGQTKNAIINYENTTGCTGFYNPTAFDSSKTIFEFDANSTNGDDDLMGAMFRFNVTSGDDSNNNNKKVTTYMLITYEGNYGYMSYSNASLNGLFKVTDELFNDKREDIPRNIKTLALNQGVAWVRGNDSNNWYKRYRVVADGPNIKVYVQEWYNKAITSDWKLVIDYTDPDPILTGSYGVFACSQPYTTFTNITATTSDEKSFSQSLMETNWRDDSLRFVINVEDKLNTEFTTEPMASEILSRTLNDNINFVEWGQNSNKTAMTNFIKRNNGNGTFITNTSYSKSLDETVVYIKSKIDEFQASQANLIVNTEFDLNVKPSNLINNTTDSEYPNGRWYIDHDNNYFENSTYQYSGSGYYRDDIDIHVLDKIGKYTLKYENVAQKELIVHRRPTASFSMNFNSGVQFSLSSKSNDLDTYSKDIGFGPGIADEEWSYKIGSQDTWIPGKITNFSPDETYVIQLKVKDFQGTWSNPTTKYITKAASDLKPVAEFSFKLADISKHNADINNNINNTSYDPAGRTIDKYTWKVTKDGKTVADAVTTSLNAVPTVNFQQYGVGDYKYELKVSTGGIVSNPYSQIVSVTEDITKPEIIITTNGGNWVNSETGIRIQIDIVDNESKIKEYKFKVDNSPNTPTADLPVYNADNKDKTDIIVNTDTDGVYYVHLEVEDNAGNKTTVHKGPYGLDRVKPVLEYVSTEDLSEEAPVLTTFTLVDHLTNKKVKVTVKATDDLSGINRVEYKLDNQEEYSTAIPRNNNNYTFNIVDNYEGNISVYAYDNAGNKSEELLIENIRIINSPPNIEIGEIPGWTNAYDVRVPVSITSNKGLDISEAAYKAENIYDLEINEDGSYTAIFEDEGEYYFTVIAIDAAGAHFELKSEEPIRIDRTNPEITRYNYDIIIDKEPIEPPIVEDPVEPEQTEPPIIDENEQLTEPPIIEDNTNKNEPEQTEPPVIEGNTDENKPEPPIKEDTTEPEQTEPPIIEENTDEVINLNGESGYYPVSLDSVGASMIGNRTISFLAYNSLGMSNGISLFELEPDNTFWSSTNVTIHAQDILGVANSGIDTISYKLESDIDDFMTDWITVSTATNSVEFEMTSEFSGTIYSKCGDIAGNESDVYSEHIILDRTNPNPTVIVNTEDGNWTNTTGEVNIQAFDNQLIDTITIKIINNTTGDSVVDSELEIDNKNRYNETFILDEDGEYSIEVTVTDLAGHTSSADRTIKIDKTKPVINRVMVNEVDDSGNILAENCVISTNNLNITVNAEDSLSGIKELEYKLDNQENWVKADSLDNFTLTDEYNGSVAIRVIDNAGNISDHYTIENVIIDKGHEFDTPKVNLGDYTDGNWTNKNIDNIVVYYDKGTEPTSGINRYEYKEATSNEWKTGTPSITTTSEKAYEFRAISNVGGISKVTSQIVIKVDKDIPVISKADVEYKNREIRIDVESTDVGSGIQKIKYSTDGNSWIDAADNTIILDKSYRGTLEIKAVDVSGNESEVYTVTNIKYPSDNSNSGGGSHGGSTVKPNKDKNNNKNEQTSKDNCKNYCVVPKLNNSNVISKFSYLDISNDKEIYLKPVAGQYLLVKNHRDFKDITYDWSFESVHALAAREMINGYTDGTFKPNNNITRAEFAIIMVRLFDINIDLYKNVNPTFSDVDKTSFSFPYIEAAYDNNIMVGFNSKEFGPNQFISRQEIAKVLYNVMVKKNIEVNTIYTGDFKDYSSVGDWAKTAITGAINSGIMNGYTDHTLKPNNNATRAESCKLIFSMIKYIVDHTDEAVYKLSVN